MYLIDVVLHKKFPLRLYSFICSAPDPTCQPLAVPPYLRSEDLDKLDAAIDLHTWRHPCGAWLAHARTCAVDEACSLSRR